MMNQDSEHRLSQLIEELGPAEPPAGFVRQVMARISLEEHHQVRGRIIPFSKGGIAMTKKAMWGLAAAAVIILGVYTYTGFPPVDSGTDGTIGSAQKYQAPQLSDKDVVLGDATAQEFLQSELFDQLAKDPDARALVTNASVKAALEDAEFRNVIADQVVRNALISQAVHSLYRSAELRAELESQVRSQLSAAEVKKAMAQSDVRGADARASVARVLSDAAIGNALRSDVVRRALDNGLLRQVLADARMARALNSYAFVNAVAARGFAPALHANMIERSFAQR